VAERDREKSTMKRSGKFRDRLCLWFGGVIATATILGIGLSYLASMPLLMKEFGGQLKSVAAGAAAEIDGDLFDTLKGNGAFFKTDGT